MTALHNFSTDISVIIPAKDEEKRLPIFLAKVRDYCQKSIKQYEIIVVDDGSTDKTREIAQSFEKGFECLKVIKLPVNHGKGYAVKTGVLAAKGQVVLFMDADGSTPVDEIEKKLPYLDKGYDIVIGSRKLKSIESVVKARFHRKLIGAIFNFFVTFFLFKDIQDSQCGFKMFRKAVVKPLFSKVTINGFGFDMEVLYLAFKMGLKVKESAVSWQHESGSKVNVFKDSFKMFYNIFQIRCQHYFSSNFKTFKSQTP
ncbi:hypothetical protein MNBD_UNCLBAC01-561 [hydrothermal vent metagenome]|uniref:dolichyl-phosphate beta-glucosyltransferase n=1 Tax=hydrothermal vent metagenome TaxID=652676 RepID=A0A3B1DYJ1_9ZZZZ